MSLKVIDESLEQAPTSVVIENIFRRMWGKGKRGGGLYQH